MHGGKVILGEERIGREGNNRLGDFSSCSGLGVVVVKIERKKIPKLQKIFEG